MEHIGKPLGRLDRAAPTQNQMIIEPEHELTPEEHREKLRQALCVSSLDNTFDNFKPAPGTGKTLAAFKALALGKTKWKMLLCYGGVGNGKTHLCEAAAITLYGRGLFCRVLTMTTIMGVLKSYIGSEKRNAMDEIMHNYCYADRLILDDIGMGGSGSEWEYGKLEEIIVIRYRERLFTILTTNKDLTELPERIISRFKDADVGRIVLNEGKDYRGLKGKK